MPVKSDIRVIIAEDSPTVRRHLSSIIGETPGMRVVGEARDGLEVIQLVNDLRPDVVSMDISMPRLDGLEATRRIMTEVPTPIVVVSSMLDQDIQLSFRALQAGALAVVEKPPDRRSPDFQEKQRELVKTLLAMADVKVISRRRRTGPLEDNDQAGTEGASRAYRDRVRPELIAIGSSTGGPSALNKLLRDLPEDLPLPVVVVQHMTDEFIAGLARWLNNVAPLHVKVVADGEVLKPGVVHLSPGDAHLTISRRGVDLVARLLPDQGAHRHQPSVDVLFLSIARTCGTAAIGCILTGMGDDGANGLLAMRQVGAMTFAQDRATSTVFGMPQAAIERGAAEQVVPLPQLATEILKII